MNAENARVPLFFLIQRTVRPYILSPTEEGDGGGNGRVELLCTKAMAHMILKQEARPTASEIAEATQKDEIILKLSTVTKNGNLEIDGNAFTSI
uniref:Uncharacterized protein n=1 Tax=Globodera rostochiensis TaxID=31243 RepID=A0A914HRL0_GLORO